MAQHTKTGDRKLALIATVGLGSKSRSLQMVGRFENRLRSIYQPTDLFTKRHRIAHAALLPAFTPWPEIINLHFKHRQAATKASPPPEVENCLAANRTMPISVPKLSSILAKCLTYQSKTFLDPQS
jgi:hypothetical protein